MTHRYEGRHRRQNRRPLSRRAGLVAAQTTAALVVAVACNAPHADARSATTTTRSVASSITPAQLFMSGTVRCTDGVWAAIDDAAHTPYGIASVTTLSDRVRVTYAAPLFAVSSLQATPDETYARAGVTVGASVGLTYTDLLFTDDGTPASPASVCLPYSNVWLTGWEATE